MSASELLPGITATELVRRAVTNARTRHQGNPLRWIAIMDTFSLGSGNARMLCRRFGFDPDERISTSREVTHEQSENDSEDTRLNRGKR